MFRFARFLYTTEWSWIITWNIFYPSCSAFHENNNKDRLHWIKMLLKTAFTLVRAILLLYYIILLWIFFSLICTILVAIPPSMSIQCYRQTCYDHDCSVAQKVVCKGADDDGCGNVALTTGSSIKISVSNCSRSQYDSSQTVVCERVVKLMEGYMRDRCGVLVELLWKWFL